MAHWRATEMAEYQDAPYTQFAFILNLEQHWFTLRRFGLAEVVEQATPEEAEHVHWFNLNSFLHHPEWIGRIYLKMMLSQAEEEGMYHTFDLSEEEKVAGWSDAHILP